MAEDAGNTGSTQNRPGSSQGALNTKRTNTACIKCRERKVRCSGTCPCTNCSRRSAECIFEPDEKKVLVSERFLNELKRRAEANDLSSLKSPTKRQHELITSLGRGDGHGAVTHHLIEPQDVGAGPSGQEILPNIENPLASTPSRFLTDFQGRRRFLGPSSTWAYSRHVMSMIGKHLGQHQSPEVPLNTDGAAFTLEFPSRTHPGMTITMQDLPSRDYAIYLLNTVKFHVCQTYHLFDEPSFMQAFSNLYSEGPQPLNPKNRLWYVQYFIIMAFGKALLMRGSSRANPYGSEYLSRAMELLPDVNGLYEDPIISVEICCGLSLYLQSVDHRNSAYVYLGLALRIALTQGFHRDLVSESDGPGDTTRYQSAWWTLYILDRKFSSTMGAPSSINDNDVTVSLPSTQKSMQTSSALEMHVKLARLVAEVLNTIYSIDGRLHSSFLKNVQVILRQLAALAVELNASETSLDSPDPISRVSATVNLCYHQCIVLATRPLLMCLLRDKLEQRNDGNKESRGMAGPIKAFLKTSCESASKSLGILSALQSQDLLETFLPFDLETAFSAGFVLALISAIQSPREILDDASPLQTASSIIKCLISHGNVPARFRLEELERLQEMLMLVTLQTGSSFESHDLSAARPDPADVAAHTLSPNQMLAIAELIEYYPTLGDAGPGVIDNAWLWESGDPSAPPY
ncbi:fungal-specific transcription factor domain-containing protein [Ilyonectria sp. MPI-CAGE-AT-0026]|nr:fungal-specific transcription factor domain-containing protein [Ilyonectria sp. MPI-CAGE-AT-0026]